MNKKLVALAVAGAFALPLAAQAQTANVTLYGRLNIDFEFVKGKTCPAATSPTGAPGTAAGCNVGLATESTQNTTVNRLSSNSSRLGVRGTESLGGGLNAIFQIESSINGDTSGGNLGGRETFVGLQGSWGKFTAGRFLMPLDDLHPIFGNAPTLTTSILSTAALWAQGPLNKAQGGFDARLGNSLRYDSPNLQGFTGAVQYSTRDSSGAAGGGDNGDHPSELLHANVIGGNLIYANGPWQVGVAVEHNKDVRGAGLKDTDWSVTGAYDFGTIMQGFGLRLAGVFERTKYDTPTGDLKRNFWGVSGTVPVGGGKVYLFWGRAGKGTGGAADGTAIGGLVKGDNTRADQWEVSYSYSLSPRTLLYTGYVRINNQDKARYQFNINSYPIAPGGDPSGLVFGIVHFF